MSPRLSARRCPTTTPATDDDDAGRIAAAAAAAGRTTIVRAPLLLNVFCTNTASLCAEPPPRTRTRLPLASIHGLGSRRLYILCWSELSRRKLSPPLATPTTLVLTTLVAQCELSRRKIGLLLQVVGRKFSHRPGNPATVGVVRGRPPATLPEVACAG